MGRRTASLLVALALVALAVGAVAPSAGQEANASDYGIEELKKTGTTHDGAPPSMRFLSQYGSATLRYEPAGLGKSSWEYLEPGSTVHDDSITLRTVRLAPRSELDRTLNVTVVSWQKGQREVVQDNTTVKRPAAKNVSVRRTQVELGRGYDNATVNLPSHYTQTWQISMWIEEYPNARWRFEHRSVETSRSVPFDADWGGFWSYNFSNLLLPILVLTSAVAVGIPSSLRKTARGPNVGLVLWGIILTVLAGIVASVGYLWTTSLLATAPWVVAAVVAGLVGIIMLETISYGVYDVVFLRFFTEDGKNPRGDLAAKANGGEFEIVTLANVDDGIIALTDGFRPWLARLWCGGSYLQGTDRLENEFSLGNAELSLSRSPAEKLLFVAQEPDFLIKYEPETLELDLPMTKVVDEETGETAFDLNGIASVLIYTAVGAAVGYGAFQAGNLPTPQLGLAGALLTVLVKWTRAVPGEAYWHPAVGGTEDAVATAMYHETELDQYQTLEDALTALVNERNSEDELLGKLEELDAESIVKDASSRDSSPGDFVDGSSPSQEAAGGDD